MNQQSHPPRLNEAIPAGRAVAFGTGLTDHQERLSVLARKAAVALSPRAISPTLLTGFARFAEWALIAAAGAAVYFAYVVPGGGANVAYTLPILVGSLLAVLFIQLAGCYRMSALRTPVSALGRVYAAWLLVFAVLWAVAFFVKIGDQYSRVWVGGWLVAGLVLLTLFRICLAVFVRRRNRDGLLERRAVIVGGGAPAERIIRALEADGDDAIRIVGIFDDRNDNRSPPIVAGYPKLGSVADLADFARIAGVDLLIVSLPITAEARLLQLLKQLWLLPVEIRLSAHADRLRLRPRAYSYVGKMPRIDVIDKPIVDWDHVAKWLFDRVIGTIALAMASPIMAAAALAIRLDTPGPVLVRRRRYGFNKEPIEVYEFRSMHTDANPARLTATDDPRLTRVGRFIRKTGIDDLPQLFNVVLKGNLSLVGPRPHAVRSKVSDRLYSDVVDGYFVRHRIKPGMTGWAQINGRRGENYAEDEIQQRVEHDLRYIENWSVLLDLTIVVMTPIRRLVIADP